MENKQATEKQIPKHQLITADLINKITMGVYPEGSLLPGEFELAKIYSASRNTIRTSLGNLERTFRIKRIQGRGTVVLPPVDARNTSEYASRGFTNYLRNNTDGAEIRTRTLLLEAAPCPDGFRELFPDYVDLGHMLSYKRVYCVDGAPVALISSYIQTHDLPGIEKFDFEKVSFATVVRRLGVDFRYRRGHCKAVAADESEAEALRLCVGAPLLRYRYETYDARMSTSATLEVGTIYLNTEEVPFIVDSFH